MVGPVWAAATQLSDHLLNAQEPSRQVCGWTLRPVVSSALLSPGSTGAESLPAPGVACSPGSALTRQASKGLDRPPSSPTRSQVDSTATGCVEALCILGYLLNKTPKLASRHHLLRGQSRPAAPGGLGTTVGGQQWQHEDKGGCDIWASGHLLQPSQPPQGLGAALVPMSH